MLTDLIMALQSAKIAEDKEKAYRQLEQVGMDRITAAIVAAETEVDGSRERRPADSSDGELTACGGLLSSITC